MSALLEEKVLVLNKGWVPIGISTVREAVIQVYQGVARVVDPRTFQTFNFNSWKDAAAFAKDATRFLHGCSWSVFVPEVIVLDSYTGINKRQVKFSRRNLFYRDRYTCQYCGKRFPTKDLTIDHVIPKSVGGRSVWSNVVLACYKCNRKKDNRTPVQARMPLLKQPRQPRWEEVKVPALHGKIPESWETFMSEMYWEVELKN